MPLVPAAAAPKSSCEVRLLMRPGDATLPGAVALKSCAVLRRLMLREGCAAGRVLAASDPACKRRVVRRLRTSASPPAAGHASPVRPWVTWAMSQTARACQHDRTAHTRKMCRQVPHMTVRALTVFSMGRGWYGASHSIGERCSC